MNDDILTHEAAEALLQRYFAAETTLAEEEQLRAYFRSGHAAPELRAYDPLFDYWARARVHAGERKSRQKRAKRLPLRRMMAAAAAILLLLTVYLTYPNEPAGRSFPIAAATTPEPTPIDWSRYEVTDPEEAVRVLHGALKTASSELNRGTRITVRELRSAHQLIR